MPRRPNIPCKHPGCAALIPHGQMYCEEHKPLHTKDRAHAAERGYGAKWQRERRKFLESNDWNGKAVYGAEVTGGSGLAAEFSNADCPFMVKVSIDDLNIRKGAGTNTTKTGRYTGKGVFTIMEVKNGKGSDNGWGRLKSGAGWIALDYCQKI